MHNTGAFAPRWSTKSFQPQPALIASSPALRSQRLHPKRHQITRIAAQGAGLREVLEKLISRQDLTTDQTQQALQELLSNADAAQTAAFLVLLRSKGETAEEVMGLAKGMLSNAVPVSAEGNLVDIVGTGGDGIGSVNISTGAAILAAAAGAKVAKHGSRSVSSLCGSADVLEAMGVSVELGPESISKCLDAHNIGFMFAPRYHPVMKVVSPVRRALRIRTAFNLLGPLLNPARPPYGLIGIYSPSIAPLMASALQGLGTRKALVVHSGGLDELTPLADADVLEVTPEGTRSFTVEPQRMGIQRCTVEDLKGGDASLNAAILRDVFAGKKGPVADALCLNAGFALAASQVTENPEDGVALAQEIQVSGKALSLLEGWARLSQQLQKEEERA